MRARVLVLAVALLALAGCADDDDDDDVRAGGTGSATAPATRLTVEVRPAPDQPPRQGTLTCDGSPAGTGHLGDDPDAACDAVLTREGRRRLVEGPEPDRLCTQLYGGPEQATVTGTVEGERVDATFDRKDGCGVAEWDEFAALLGGAPPAASEPAY